MAVLFLQQFQKQENKFHGEFFRLPQKSCSYDGIPGCLRQNVWWKFLRAGTVHHLQMRRQFHRQDMDLQNNIQSFFRKEGNVWYLLQVQEPPIHRWLELLFRWFHPFLPSVSGQRSRRLKLQEGSRQLWYCHSFQDGRLCHPACEVREGRRWPLLPEFQDGLHVSGARNQGRSTCLLFLPGSSGLRFFLNHVP